MKESEYVPREPEPVLPENDDMLTDDERNAFTTFGKALRDSQRISAADLALRINARDDDELGSGGEPTPTPPTHDVDDGSLRRFTLAVATKIGADISFSEAMEREGCSTIDLVAVLVLAENPTTMRDRYYDGYAAAIDAAVDLTQWHACLSGDCPHQRWAECEAAIADQLRALQPPSPHAHPSR